MDQGMGIVGVVMFLFVLAVMILMIVSMWKIFERAGEPGWGAIIPIYNTILMIKIAGKPIWWFFLMMIPFVNFVIVILLFMALAENFGKDKVLWGLGLAFVGIVFFPLLAFSDAEYIGTKEF